MAIMYSTVNMPRLASTDRSLESGAGIGGSIETVHAVTAASASIFHTIYSRRVGSGLRQLGGCCLCIS